MLKNVVGLVTGGASGLGKVSLSFKYIFNSNFYTAVNPDLFKGQRIKLQAKLLAVFKFYCKQEKDCSF